MKQDKLGDDAAANAVAVAAANAAARILEVRHCLEVCGLNQQMTDAIWHVSKRNSYILVFYLRENYYGAKYLIKYVRVHELSVDFIPMSRTK